MECSGNEMRLGDEVPMMLGWTLAMEVTALLLVPIMVETIPYGGTKMIQHFKKLRKMNLSRMDLEQRCPTLSPFAICEKKRFIVATDRCSKMVIYSQIYLTF